MDNGSGAPVDPRVLQEMLPYFTEHVGNPSSFHSEGFKALKAINRARQQIADLINAEPAEIFFTASATEATNLAIIGGAIRYKNKGNRVVSSAVEHISTVNICKELTRTGWEYQQAPVDADGVVLLDKLDELVTDKTVIVTVMAANGEIGTIQPIKDAAAIAHKKGAFFHTDATAALGKIPLDVKAMDIDMMTLSSNDIYGPKGVGALYVKKILRLRPVIIGGGQEQGLRSGTENTPGIVGFGKAAELAKQELPTEAKRLTGLRDHLIKGITSTIPETYLNGHTTNRTPNNANVRFSYIEGEALILSLDDVGLQVNTGSACAAKTLEPSACLLATGLKPEDAHGSLVFTLGKANNKEQIDYVIQQLPAIVKRLRSMSSITPEELK
ncbi:TPA: aminotransferase class V-fold PLP-dependent enzyme [Candidatus Bathyarchaeota archaeon]|nr:aminotransferase class V-fold PLP-dependent enzyme [Candidatus Bathyarchaeota archaeon]